MTSFTLLLSYWYLLVVYFHRRRLCHLQTDIILKMMWIYKDCDMLYSNSPKIQPCETPLVFSVKSGLTPFVHVSWYLFFK